MGVFHRPGVKRAGERGPTFYAQGGIAAVFDETDSIASHVEDTIAGAGICDRHAVELSPATLVPACSGLSIRASV